MTANPYDRDDVEMVASLDDGSHEILTSSVRRNLRSGMSLGTVTLRTTRPETLSDSAATALRITRRTLFAAVLWLVVAEGALDSLTVGAPMSVAAAAISVRLSPQAAPRLRTLGLFRFASFFLVQSVLGGLDVAVRALKPSMPLDPGYVAYPLRLKGVHARVLFVNTISLLPGTLSAHLESDRLIVHALDCSRPVLDELRLVEERVGGVFVSEGLPSGEIKR